MKLIKREGHFYILSDKKIVSHKIGDYVYEKDRTIPVHELEYDIDSYPLYRLIASTLGLGGFPCIDFRQLQKSFLEYLAKGYYPEDTGINIDLRENWVENTILGIKDVYGYLEWFEDDLMFDIELEMRPKTEVELQEDGSKFMFVPILQTIKVKNGHVNILKIK